ncbi:mucin-15 isoform X2 [Coturnix japonica]|uniref:mucin-15 isoform X2 n=1 Tax=Coturnix japonica TaxID=93934 RepID=UPI000777C2E4|nr:mucin-15 isoform X2 [Coturnix japonica]
MFLFLLALLPSALSQTAATANANKNATERREMSRQPVSTPLTSTDGTMLPSTFTAAPRDGRNSSAPNLKRILISSATLTTPGDFSTTAKDAASVSADVPFTATLSSSAPTVSTHQAAALPSDSPSTIPTTIPAGSALTSPTMMQDSPTPDLNTIQQTADLKHSFTNTSPVLPKEEDTNKGKTSKTGVIVGITVGVLGSILIGLMGCFLCDKERSESFSHRRLYDTRNDPDNSLGPYETSFGTAPDGECSTADNAECPHDSIPMDDVTPSDPDL